MADKGLVPTREELDSIVERTLRFLSYLRDAQLVDGVKSRPVPASTVAYRRGQVLCQWVEWDRALNPSNAHFGGAPAGVAAGGWPDWEMLHFALTDLQALRTELISHWGI